MWSTLLFGVLLALPGHCRNDFSDTFLSTTPLEPQEDVELRIDFTLNFGLNETDTISFKLPKFTSGGGRKTPGPNIPERELHISPSIYFDAQWIEGAFKSTEDPFFNSTMVLHVKPGVWVQPGTQIKLRVYKTNGLRVYCGFAPYSDVPAGEMWTNSTNSADVGGPRFKIESSDRVGKGCNKQADCLKKGECNFCLERCECYEGHGKGDVGDQSGDCSILTCPAAKAWAWLPTDEDSAHPDLVECSGAGLCDPSTGLCDCFPEFTGDACQRRICQNDCSGHGQCLTMGQVARPGVDALPLSNATEIYYGDVDTKTTTAWDWDTLQHCVCDSRWPVGLGAGEYQVPEFFGADCSRKHCPSGPIPDVSWKDAEDCANVTAAGGKGHGAPGNLCHVECSGRGSCDFLYGNCECFPGYMGYDCGTLVKHAGAVS